MRFSLWLRDARAHPRAYGLLERGWRCIGACAAGLPLVRVGCAAAACRSRARFRVPVRAPRDERVVEARAIEHPAHLDGTAKAPQSSHAPHPLAAASISAAKMKC